MTKADLLEQVSIVTKNRSGVLRICVGRDGVGLGIAVVKPMDDLIWEWNVRTVFPMTRTGCASFLGTYGGSCSTERTGHPYEV